MSAENEVIKVIKVIKVFSFNRFINKLSDLPPPEG